jgi:hypothetical protein
MERIERDQVERERRDRVERCVGSAMGEDLRSYPFGGDPEAKRRALARLEDGVKTLQILAEEEGSSDSFRSGLFGVSLPERVSRYLEPYRNGLARQLQSEMEQGTGRSLCSLPHPLADLSADPFPFPPRVPLHVRLREVVRVLSDLAGEETGPERAEESPERTDDGRL